MQYFQRNRVPSLKNLSDVSSTQAPFQTETITKGLKMSADTWKMPRQQLVAVLGPTYWDPEGAGLQWRPGAARHWKSPQGCSCQSVDLPRGSDSAPP